MPSGSLYQTGDELLLVLANSRSEEERVHVTVDLSVFLPAVQGLQVTIYGIDSDIYDVRQSVPTRFSFEQVLEGHDLLLLHFKPGT